MAERYRITSAGRKRRLRAGEGELKVYYGSPGDGEPADLCTVWGAGVGKRRSNLMFALLGPFLKFPEGRIVRGTGEQDFAAELDAAGFDLSTLVISIKLKSRANEPVGGNGPD